ncbi:MULTISPECIES: response regulator transcription factor [Pseudoalteromonas]|uniref:response regulator transcription factor n=1 Tax=Pseudoalteromonas TaxID=53246 RepID=UPI000C7CC64F|nr:MULTISPECIES: response regulator transcription factor [Pseudoalteromonas]AUJ68945.1 CsgBAC operon transcriptional regulatory protein [Pseudoalteromonas sp. NC201]MBR8842390.1 response regulator transcription factor [Pseudoalteromonas sp. JC3]MCF2825950.1 response regulator transcription factor [Pseudoalteromonas sp. OF5H-5]MCF2829972.1 response regulator transcription factor [Pseudoalteromonas sp. DL2-H6]MCF2925391.1 response regulator transcription factor [Pseudoalteromonas sp. DL2-H1]
MFAKEYSNNSLAWQDRAFFILTHARANTSSTNYTVLIKVLETLGHTVKVDTRLPESAQREQIALFLVDTEHRDCNELISAEVKLLAAKHKVLLFNANEDNVNEKTALLGNVKGILYRNAPPETLFQGLSSVLKGELWFCRSAISEAFSELIAAMPQALPNSDIILSNEELNMLTGREKSVIKLIAAGAKNEDIADRLNISSHTVKTHIYSAFKKTNSRNRVELANWALRHIPIVSLN